MTEHMSPDWREDVPLFTQSLLEVVKEMHRRQGRKNVIRDFCTVDELLPQSQPCCQSPRER